MNMPSALTHLDRWQAAGLIDLETAGRILAWETEHPDEPATAASRRWPVILALTFGALLLTAGLLLFVSAHWDQMSPWSRFALVLGTVGSLHAAAALVHTRFQALSVTLHAIGTLSLGAAIALTGQIFNLSEHWPGGIMLWAAGAAAAWAILRQWPQAALAAILIPAWLASECFAFHWFANPRDTAPAFAGLCALSLVYLGARRSAADSPDRKALCWIGAIFLLPLAALTNAWRWHGETDMRHTIAWAVAVILPLALAFFLDRSRMLDAGVAVAWTMMIPVVAIYAGHDGLMIHIWYALGSALLAWWGVADGRMERINLGMAGFAFTILFFYFSSLMDKLGRSASLITLGILFLGGGWLLEVTRRRLISRMQHGGLAA